MTKTKDKRWGSDMGIINLSHEYEAIIDTSYENLTMYQKNIPSYFYCSAQMTGQSDAA